jgi:hypothetical protein
VIQPWTLELHYLAPRKIREQIATVMKLTLRPTGFAQLPNELLFFICRLVATSDNEQDNVEPLRKKRKRAI